MLYFLILIGLIFGSFLNVLIHRLPNDESIIFASSNCPYCKENILWYHNIPVFSFLLLKGYSNCCNKPISIRYLFVEIASMLLWVWSYYYINSISDQILFLIIASCLLVIIFTDFSHFIVPLELNIVMFLSSLIIYLYNAENIIDSIYSMLFLSLYFLVLMFLIGFLFKKEAMGYGDIILIGVIGFWLGWIDTFIIIFFSSVLSLIHWLLLFLKTNKKDIQLPFGSSISVITIILYIIKETFQINTQIF